jgi:hypothetical protein
MLPAALQAALIDACHAAGTPRLALVFGSVARHLTDVADFMPAYQRVIDQRLAALTNR